MVKESSNNAHPKAVNIVRPTNSFSVKRSTQPSPSIPNHKPRVARSAKINVDEEPYSVTTTKTPQLNIYHPPPRRSQSQKRTTLSTADTQRQQLRSKPRPIATVTTTTATTGSKPSFEVYKPPIKQPLARSRTTPVLPSATSSTPISISDHFQRHHPQKQHEQQQQQQRRPISQTSSTHTQLPLARSVTHHSLSISSTPAYIDDDDEDKSTSESSNENSEDESSDVYSEKHQRLLGNHTETLVTDSALDTKGEKGTNSSDEEEDEDSVVIEARVNRKIADLEISNRSLLAVNEMLEMTVRRQASQVAQLKQQIAQDGTVEIKPFAPPVEQSELQMDSDEEWEKDESFHRIRQMTEKMIESGEASLQYQCRVLGGRVLSRYGKTEEENDANDDDIDDYDSYVSEEGDETDEGGSDEDAEDRHKDQNTNAPDQRNPLKDPDELSLREQQDEATDKWSFGRSSTPRRRFYYSESITWQPK